MHLSVFVDILSMFSERLQIVDLSQKQGILHLVSKHLDKDHGPS
jgi:hypothetical protein